jgi:RND family efflux transporter MFP subunit
MKHILQPLSLLLAATLFTSCSRNQPPAAAPIKVTVSRPQLETVTNWDEYPGHLEAVEMVEIRPRLSGYIDSIHFEDGTEVRAGDLLFVIDPRPYQAELDRARAQRLQSETRLALARNDLSRAETLRGTKAISEEEYDSRNKAAREAEGGLGAAKAAEAAAQLNLDYTRITAPINGKIGRRLVTAGNLVQGGGSGSSGTVLAALVTMDPVYCYFDVAEEPYTRYRTERDVQNIAGQADGPLACELGLVGEPGFPRAGHVDFFDNQVDEKTGTIRVRGVFANPKRALTPGMFARVRVPAGPAAQTLLIPDVAVGFDQNYKFVYVVNSTNTVETRTIETGRSQGPLRAVLKGLTPQDRVVVNGLVTLRAGAKVEAQEASAGGALPSGTAAAGDASGRP